MPRCCAKYETWICCRFFRKFGARSTLFCTSSDSTRLFRGVGDSLGNFDGLQGEYGSYLCVDNLLGVLGVLEDSTRVFVYRERTVVVQRSRANQSAYR